VLALSAKSQSEDAKHCGGYRCDATRDSPQPARRTLPPSTNQVISFDSVDGDYVLAEGL
jgi:hypothetical protein